MITFNDPRLEYQKLIDQNHRLFLILIPSVYSLIVASIFKFNLGFASAFFGSVLPIILSMIWKSRTAKLIAKENAVLSYYRQVDRAFRDFTDLEKSMIEKDKYAKGFKKGVDYEIPGIFFAISIGVLGFCAVALLIELFKSI